MNLHLALLAIMAIFLIIPILAMRAHYRNMRRNVRQMEAEGLLDATTAALLYHGYSFFGNEYASYKDIQRVDDYVAEKQRQRVISKNLRTETEKEETKKSKVLDWLSK